MKVNAFRFFNSATILLAIGSAHAAFGTELVRVDAKLTITTNARTDHFVIKSVIDADGKTKDVFSRDKATVEGKMTLKADKYGEMTSALKAPDLSKFPMTIETAPENTLIVHREPNHKEKDVKMTLSTPMGGYVYSAKVREKLYAEQNDKLLDSAPQMVTTILSNPDVAQAISPVGDIIIDPSVDDNRSATSPDECFKPTSTENEMAMTYAPSERTVNVHFFVQPPATNN